MKKPNKMSRKGWKLYSSGNVVSTFSSVFIAIALILTIFLLIPMMSPDAPYAFDKEDVSVYDSDEGGVYHFSVKTVPNCLLAILILNVLALLFVLIGKLLFWKGLTFLLGALQIPESIIPDTTSEATIQEAKSQYLID